MNRRARPWRLVGGDPSLDFANTLGGRVASDPPGTPERIVAESLESYADLLEWQVFAGLLDQPCSRRLERLAVAHPSLAATTHRRALALREAVYRIACALIVRSEPTRSDLLILNDELQAALQRRRVVAHDGALTEIWMDPEEHLDSILWPIAYAATRLFVGGPRDRLKRCPGRACGWLFLDRTKNRGRQWCSMSDCGNLSKVRLYRQRQRSDSATGRTARRKRSRTAPLR
jgi:predicted RNA-binding Zn ribbon-like protein